MPESTPSTPRADGRQRKEPSESSSVAQGRLRDRLTSRKALAILLGLSMFLHFLGLALLIGVICYPDTGSTEPPTEITLGDYEFRADPADMGRIDRATFTLHIALLPQLGESARSNLKQRAFRVREEVEELMRQAHSGDFEDPSLGELKRQLQERINKALGVRAISDVIITQLSVYPNQRLVEQDTTPLELEPLVIDPIP